MMLVFGGLSLLLAAVGIYGVIAFSVTRRTHEIGLRMALGASRPEVLRLIGKEGVGLLLVGLALGGPAVLLVSRAVGASMQQLGVPIDPSGAWPMLAILVAVALVASFLPAYRASRLQPAIALRHD
jgi:ABC-type antimicrobial peptide transport system permease subunit